MRNVSVQTKLPILDDDGLILQEPITILDRRMIKQGDVAATEVMVQWRNTFPENATWELLPISRAIFQNSIFEDKDFL